MLFRDHDGDCDAIVARVLPDKTLRLAVLFGSGSWGNRDHVARDTQKDDKGILIQGMWRFP